MINCRCGNQCQCSLADDIADLEQQVQECLRDCDDKQRRNKRAIELHTKLERACNDVERLTDSPEARLLKSRLRVLTERLLVEVFKIEPEQAASASSTPRTRDQHRVIGRVDPTNGVSVTKRTGYANDDVAAVEYDLTVGNKTTKVVGTAKRNPTDKPDQVTGLLVANAKAFRKMAQFFETAERDRLAAADKVRKEEAQVKAQHRADARRLQSQARARRTQKQLQDEVDKLRVDLTQAQAGAKKLAAIRKDAAKKTAPAKKKAPAKRTAAPRKRS